MNDGSGLKKFSPEVMDALGIYIYRLVDPRNGATFYIGKGKGNRVFQHEVEAGKDPQAENIKLARINEIRNQGLEVIRLIHRHGIENDDIALQIEAVLMDAYPGLTNLQGGFGSDYSCQHVSQIMERYEAPLAEFEDASQFLIIKIKESKIEERGSRLEATRGAWALNLKNASSRKYVLSVTDGIIKAVYEPAQWDYATLENFPRVVAGLQLDEKRIFFKGGEAPSHVSEKYIRRRLPQKYMQKGAANPAQYA